MADARTDAGPALAEEPAAAGAGCREAETSERPVAKEIAAPGWDDALDAGWDDALDLEGPDVAPGDTSSLAAQREET